MKFSDKNPASEFSQGYKPLTSSGSVLMTIPRVEEVFCPERLSATRTRYQEIIEFRPVTKTILILCGTILRDSIRSGEFLSYIPRGVGAFGLLLTGRTRCVLPVKRNPNTDTCTSRTIWDKNSPNSVSCRIGFSTLYPSSRGQTGQLQDQWPWWQRTFLGRMSPKSHGVCACLRPSDPRSP